MSFKGITNRIKALQDERKRLNVRERELATELLWELRTEYEPELLAGFERILDVHEWCGDSDKSCSRALGSPFRGTPFHDDVLLPLSALGLVEICEYSETTPVWLKPLGKLVAEAIAEESRTSLDDSGE